MTYEPKTPFGQCTTLLEALLLVKRLGIREGMLQVSNETTHGWVVFHERQITGAVILETEEQSEAALSRLAELVDLKCQYVAVDVGSGMERRVPNRAKATVSTSRATQQLPTRPQNLTGEEAELFGDITIRDPKKEFQASDGLLVEHDKQWLEEAALRHNPFEFVQRENQFADQERSLSDKQKQLLELVKELADREAFNEEFLTQLHNAPTLTDEQKKLLDLLAAAASRGEFEQYTGQLDVEGLSITDEVLWMLTQVLKQRSLEEQQAEFSAKDEKLDLSELAQLKDFVEPARPAAAAAAPVSPILARAGFTSDFRDVTWVLERAKKEAAGGKYGVYEPEEKPTKPDYVKYVAPACITVLCVALYTVPAIFHTSNTTYKNVADQQTRIILSDELVAVSPRYQRSELPSGTTGPIVASGTNSAASDTSVDEDPTLDAEIQAVNGDPVKAIELLEKALATNPSAVQTRIELIKLLKRQKKLKRARELAIIGFRAGQCTPAEHQELWKLFMECQGTGAD